jgi:hypothetical protein
MWQKGFASPHVSYFAPSNLRLLVGRHTGMTFVEEFPLPAVSRSGLSARIWGSHGGLLGGAMVAGMWLLSFGLRSLPSDIEGLIFRRGGDELPRGSSVRTPPV